MAYDPYESLGIPKPTATAAPVASAKPKSGGSLLGKSGIGNLVPKKKVK